MLWNHDALETYVNDVIRARLAEAANVALANQLPRSSAGSGFPAAIMSPIVSSSKGARQYLATALRDLACRLDPTLGCGPNVIIARPR